MRESEVVRKGYTRIAEKYDRQRHRFKNTALLNNFFKRLGGGAKILDLGCGAGVPVAKFFADRGRKVTGIDFAEGMLALARLNVPRARFVKMDMRKLTFAENSFDGAVSFYAIIHVPRREHEKIYRGLHRILKPGGMILVNACGPGAWEVRVKDYLGVEMFWSFYGPSHTLEIIRKAGFKILWSKVLKLGGEKQFWVLAENFK